jgi:hypothetical protein
MPNLTALSAHVDATPESITASVTDCRPDSIETFETLTPEQRRQLAIDAWSIGLRAFRNAYAQAEQARLSDIGTTLKLELSQVIGQIVERQREQAEATLRRYFDPNDGELASRLDRFVDDDGELARVLARFTGPDGGVLATTLDRFVGDQSALLKRLSPTDADGVVQTLKQVLVAATSQAKTALDEALDPLRADSPVARLLYALREDLKKAETDRSEQLVTMLKALDANDPKSLLSNLVRQTRAASETLLGAMNPTNKTSPIAQLHTSLMELLTRHARASEDLLRQQQQRQDAFQKDIREVVTRIETQRTANRTSPRGGHEFEDLVLYAVKERLGAGPYVCAQTGCVIGSRPACKVGDFVVTFTEESAWAGAGVVFECKHDATYHVDKALKELDVARANRDAAVGVFVMAQSHAPPDFPTFSRHGHNILVTWDPEDPTTIYRLHAAIMLAMALATRKQQIQEHASVDAMRDIEKVLADQLDHVERMRKASEGIRKNNDIIRKELDKAEDELKELVEKAEETLRALDLGRDDEQAERAEPIAFPASEAGSIPAA